jgi:hypothetical protein
MDLLRVEELLVAIGLRTSSTLRDLLQVDKHFLQQNRMKTSSQMLYEALTLVEPHIQDMQAKTLNTMSTGERLALVKNLTDSEEHQALDRLESWQERESSQWPSRIMQKYVMTGILPSHYHEKGLGTCVMCHKEHTLWESINTADCWKHTYCDTCNLPDRICSLCDLLL